MGLGRCLADVHRGRDLAVAETMGEQLERLSLAVGQVVGKRGGGGARLGLAGELLDQTAW